MTPNTTVTPPANPARATGDPNGLASRHASSGTSGFADYQHNNGGDDGAVPTMTDTAATCVGAHLCAGPSSTKSNLERPQAVRRWREPHTTL